MKKTMKQSLLLSMSVLTLGAVFPTSVLAQTESSEVVSEHEMAVSDLQSALDLALELFFEQVPDIGVTYIDIDLKEDGSYKIDLQGYNAEGEYDYELRVAGEEISDEEFDFDDDDDDDDEILDLDNYLSIDEITQIALDTIGSGKVTDWTLEYDDDRPEWHLELDEVNGDDDDVEITLHAETGEVLELDDDD
ncbi:PepSY domain-containing protein [Fundicoccus culcitae]|uniref:PepSY domain-containing protein n=1 Tax=Fundicoccus culcitae TaxID=2969821 RepID=A0ABY5P5E5_9LACT|nr:PepSY domain-containing protein [Fundicoccus culcitae]UUX33695.1 PepSY domain-containing protein [Fundicoccus culcitae]